MQDDVRAFHVKYHHHIEDKPNPRPPSDVLRLRADLIMEEAKETAAALLLLATWSDPPKGDLFNTVARDEQEKILDTVYLDIIDGLADLTYVTEGTAVSIGIDLQEHAREVHRANMTKEVGEHLPGEKYGPAGKGKDFVPPDHSWVLDGNRHPLGICDMTDGATTPHPRSPACLNWRR